MLAAFTAHIDNFNFLNLGDVVWLKKLSILPIHKVGTLGIRGQKRITVSLNNFTNHTAAYRDLFQIK